MYHPLFLYRSSFSRTSEIHTASPREYSHEKRPLPTKTRAHAHFAQTHAKKRILFLRLGKRPREEREREIKREGRERALARKRERKLRDARENDGGCEKRGVSEKERKRDKGGTRVAKTPGSQVIIKCNQYFTYFPRSAEGELSIVPRDSIHPEKDENGRESRS